MLFPTGQLLTMPIIVLIFSVAVLTEKEQIAWAEKCIKELFGEGKSSCCAYMCMVVWEFVRACVCTWVTPRSVCATSRFSPRCLSPSSCANRFLAQTGGSKKRC